MDGYDLSRPANEQYKGRKRPAGGPEGRRPFQIEPKALYQRAEGRAKALVSNKKGRLNASDDLFLYSNEGLLTRMKDYLFE